MNLPNIVLTREILEDCLLNSKPFRDAVLDQLVISQKPRVHDQVLELMRECYSPNTLGAYSINKIAFIKGIRELSVGRPMDFVNEFIGLIKPDSYCGPTPMTTLGLADSKHLAEDYIARYDRMLATSTSLHKTY